MRQGRIDEALKEAALELSEAHGHCAQSIVQHAARQQEESDRSLEKLMNVKGADYQVAMVRASRGEVDEAFLALERAEVERDPGLFLVRTDPFLRVLHGDPRWPVFLKRMGFED